MIGAVVRLSRPLIVIDQTFDELVLREPRGRDLRNAGDPASDPLGWALTVAGRVANVPPDVVDELPMVDAMAVAAALRQFVIPTMPASSSTDTSSAPAGGETSATSSS